MGVVNISDGVSTYKKIVILEQKKEVGRAYLFIIKNSLHKQPYGLVEDVFVDELARGKGYGTILINEIIKTAKELGCYKLVAQSRYKKEHVHSWYLKCGFTDHGKNFRINF